MTIPYQRISDAFVNSIIRDESIDEVEVDGLTYCFDTPKLRVEYDRVYTGVQHLGCQESYFKKSVHVGRLNCHGIFDSEGEEIDCQFDPDCIDLDYSDGDLSISYN